MATRIARLLRSRHGCLSAPPFKHDRHRTDGQGRQPRAASRADCVDPAAEVRCISRSDNWQTLTGETDERRYSMLEMAGWGAASPASRPCTTGGQR